MEIVVVTRHSKNIPMTARPDTIRKALAIEKAKKFNRGIPCLGHDYYVINDSCKSCVSVLEELVKSDT